MVDNEALGVEKVLRFPLKMIPRIAPHSSSSIIPAGKIGQ
jgi:hypothetical protein